MMCGKVACTTRSKMMCNQVEQQLGEACMGITKENMWKKNLNPKP
jgi:hypothetical protein